MLLAEALIEEGNSLLTSRLVSSQLLHTQHILVEVNVRRVLNGEPLEEIRDSAVSAAEHAFGLLEHGIGDLMRARDGAARARRRVRPGRVPLRLPARQRRGSGRSEPNEVLAEPGDEMLRCPHRLRSAAETRRSSAISRYTCGAA